MLRRSAAGNWTKTAPTTETQKKTIYFSYETNHQKWVSPSRKDDDIAAQDHDSAQNTLDKGESQRVLTIGSHGSRHFLKNELGALEAGPTSSKTKALKGFRIKPEHIKKPMEQ
jgi:hypothetical protein